MKICPKCNEEFEHYVELCPNCGKMLRTVQQVKKQEPTIYIDPSKIGNQQKLVLREKEKNPQPQPQQNMDNSLNQNSFERNFDNIGEMNPLMTPPKKQNKIVLIIGIIMAILVIGGGGFLVVNMTSNNTPQEEIIQNVPHQEFDFSIGLEF